jgi:hypothetical protein
MTIDISGMKLLESLENVNLDGSLAKMLKVLLTSTTGWYSDRCKLIWKMKGTKYRRVYFQLVPLELYTDEIGLGLLPTPNAQDWDTGTKPETYQARKERHQEKGVNLQMSLRQMAMGMLPTPTACDIDGGVSDPNQISQRNGRWIATRKGTGTEFGAKLRDVAGKLTTGQNSQQLNPQFVLEMMGFPTDWTLLPFLNGEMSQSKQGGTQ